VIGDATYDKQNRTRIDSILGSILIGHFVFTLCRNLFLGTPEQTLWISHIATLIGGIGAFMANRFLISLALVTCLGHHLFWLIDTTTWFMTGTFAVGATAYLQNYGIAAWIQSSNHFFLGPSLLVLAILKGSVEKYAWIWATVLSLFLMMISWLFLPIESNINCAHKPWPGFETLILPFVGTDEFSWLRYLFYITLFTAFCNYLPTNLILSYTIPKCSRLFYGNRHFAAGRKNLNTQHQREAGV
jgi:hypothetical protein